MTSRSNVCGEFLEETFSKIPVKELQEAADETNSQHSALVKKMKIIFSSCKTLGHTPEALTPARPCCFAIQDCFELNSVFIIITPCNECSYRVQLLTSSGLKVSLIQH